MPRELLTFLAARRRFRDLFRPESMRVNRRLALLGFLCLDACGGDSVAPPPPPNSWVQRASVPGGGVSGASSFVIDGRIYIANGFRNGWTNVVYRYDPSQDSWQQLSSTPTSV